MVVKQYYSNLLNYQQLFCRGEQCVRHYMVYKLCQDMVYN